MNAEERPEYELSLRESVNAPAPKAIVIPAATARRIPTAALREFLSEYNCRLECDPIDSQLYVLPARFERSAT